MMEDMLVLDNYWGMYSTDLRSVLGQKFARYIISSRG